MRLENVSKTANSSQTPRYLSWKCLDNFDKVSNEKMFYVPGAAISDSSRDVLRDLFGKMKEKWTKEIEDAFSDKKTHLNISGGAHTFYFILPSIIGAIRRRQPFTRVKVNMVEAIDVEHLISADVDISFAGFEAGVIDYKTYILNALQGGYNHSRASYDDSIFFATSRDIVETYGGDLNMTLLNHDFLFVRPSGGKLSQRHALLLKARLNADPRVVSDLPFYSYMLMLHSVGIWIVFSSKKWHKDVVILQQNQASVMKRFMLYKKSLGAKYSFITRKLMRELRK